MGNRAIPRPSVFCPVSAVISIHVQFLRIHKYFDFQFFLGRPRFLFLYIGNHFKAYFVIWFSSILCRLQYAYVPGSQCSLLPFLSVASPFRCSLCPFIPRLLQLTRLERCVGCDWFGWCTWDWLLGDEGELIIYLCWLAVEPIGWDVAAKNWTMRDKKFVRRRSETCFVALTLAIYVGKGFTL